MHRLLGVTVVVILSAALSGCSTFLPLWASVAPDGTVSISPCIDVEAAHVTIEYGQFDENWELQYSDPVELEFEDVSLAVGEILVLDASTVGDDRHADLMPADQWDAMTITYDDGTFATFDDEDLDDGNWARDPAEGLFQVQCEAPSE